MEFIFIFIFLIAGIFGFNWLMGYRNQNITLDLDERYLNLNDYAKAVKAELESQGKTVDYRGNRLFIINGKQYHLIERNVSMGGFPLQHTILQISDCPPNACFLRCFTFLRCSLPSKVTPLLTRLRASKDKRLQSV